MADETVEIKAAADALTVNAGETTAGTAGAVAMDAVATNSVAADAFAGETVAASATAGVLRSPFCGSLRSKKFFMLAGLATEAGQYMDASNHCWCRETQMVFGPDGGRARPERCGPDRPCYTSALGGE